MSTRGRRTPFLDQDYERQEEHQRHILDDQERLCVPGLAPEYGRELRLKSKRLDHWSYWEPKGAPSAEVVFDTKLRVHVRVTRIAHRRECASETCIDVWSMQRRREELFGATDLFRLQFLAEYEKGKKAVALMSRDEHAHELGACHEIEWPLLARPTRRAADIKRSNNAAMVGRWEPVDHPPRRRAGASSTSA